MTNRLSLDKVNALDDQTFVATFAAVYEHSPWVAEKAAALRPFASVTALAAAFAGTVAASDETAKLSLLRAHPDLAGRAAVGGDLTDASRLEQASAGLDSLTPDEMDRFTQDNALYRERFTFPFILAVKHWNKAHILAAFGGRLNNNATVERTTALAEVDKIAFSRLLDLVAPAPSGRLTTHVLDTAQGRPAAGLPVELVQIAKDGERLVKRATTNADGRLDQPLLAGAEMSAGLWRLTFGAGAYFLATGQTLTAPAFLDLVPIRFAIANPELHYHIPLLLSPWSYSTYRGS
jgi:2-oxo-4-hydroxy-4-carboxy-5-ureidoimidazoline decarboxylase